MPVSVFEPTTTLATTSEKDRGELFADGKYIGTFDKVSIDRAGDNLQICLYAGRLGLTGIEPISVLDVLQDRELTLETRSLKLSNFKIDTWKTGKLQGRVLEIESIKGHWNC